MTAAAARGPRITPLALLAAGLALLLVGLPWGLGGSAQRAYQGLTGELLSTLPPGSVVAEHYDRGWFRSHATTELALATGASASAGPVRIRLDSQVDQGPVHWLNSGLPPVLARVQSRIELVDAPIGLPPLRIVTDLGLDGNSLSSLHLPAVDRPGVNAAYRLRTGELTGTLRFEPRTGALDLDLVLPMAELAAPRGPVARLEDLRLTSELGAGLGAGLGTALDGGDAGSGSPRSESGHSGADAPARGSDGLTREPSQRTRADRLGVRLGLAAESLSLGSQTYRQPRLGFTGEGLDWAAIADLTAAVQVLSSGAGPPPMRGLVGAALLAQLLPRLAAGQPRIRIDPVRVDSPEGPLSVRLSLEIDPGRHNPLDTRASPAAASTWIGALKAEGEIELPEPLARRWLRPRGPESVPRPGDAATVPPSALQAWLDGGWVSVREGRVTSAFRLAEGLLTINGKTFPLLGLPSAGPR